MIEQSKAVQRWTGLVEAHEGGGFVAVGDYMALVEEIEQLKGEMADQGPYINKLRDEIERLREALEKLARLGNGDQYGNSIGNEIARAALTKGGE